MIDCSYGCVVRVVLLYIHVYMLCPRIKFHCYFKVLTTIYVLFRGRQTRGGGELLQKFYDGGVRAEP